MDAGVVAVIVAGIAASASMVSSLISAKAAKNTKPISNGFAGDVLNRLGRIEQALLTHLEDHQRGKRK